MKVPKPLTREASDAAILLYNDPRSRTDGKVVITLRVMGLGNIPFRLIPSANETQHHHAERDDYFVAILGESMAILVLSTRNAKKRKEIEQILGDLGITLHDLSMYPQAPDVVEDGDTFDVNARKKATETAIALGLWTLGEDSGLVVPALGGRPGVYSARFAGTQGDDAANNRKLLAELASVPVEKRDAYYVCTAALADPTGHVHAVVEGRCWGRIIEEHRGQGGFGYDPYFLIPEYQQTFAEVSSQAKHALSHRGKALQQLRPILAQLLK
jgi:XTP/dITP diphosphohydrolase